MKKNKKYDIIIYGSLIGAIICIIFGYGDSLYILKDTSISFSKKEETNILEDTIIEEPSIMQSIDKKSLFIEYLYSINDQIIIDDVISFDMINSWDTYEVLNTTYDGEILESYYSYLVDIKISNKNATLPTSKNKSLSTNKYIVITLNFNIAYNKTTNNYLVKSIDIPV